LNEGTTNKYYSSTLFNNDLSSKTTDNLTEGTTNKYYSSSLFNDDFVFKDTDDLSEGTTNKYSQWIDTGSNIYFADNISIGSTTAPTACLTTSGKGIHLHNSNGNAFARPSLDTGTYSAPYEIRPVDSISSGGSPNVAVDNGFLRLRAGGGNSNNQASYIDLSGYSNVSDMNKNIVFGVGGSEKMRINNLGDMSLERNAYINYSILGRGIRSANRGELHLNAANITNVSEIHFGYGDGFTESKIRWTMSDRGNSSGQGTFVLYQGPSFGSGTFAERQSWKTNGDTIINGTLGIGINPSHKLHVDGDCNLESGNSYKINNTDVINSDGGSIKSYIHLNNSSQECAVVFANPLSGVQTLPETYQLALSSTNRLLYKPSTGLLKTQNLTITSDNSKPFLIDSSLPSTAGNANYMEFQNAFGTRLLLGVDGSGFTGPKNKATIGTWTNANLAFRRNGAEVMYLSTGSYSLTLNGSAYSSGSWVDGSDDRLKHNEENISNGLDTIMKLKPQIYDKTQELKEEDYNGDLEEEYIRESGFIAQEVYTIPELEHCVFPGDETTPWGLRYQGIIPYNVKAIQELNDKVLQQQETINSQQETINALQTELSIIKAHLGL
jgi:hypothetical protein